MCSWGRLYFISFSVYSLLWLLSMADFHLRANMTTFPQRVSSTRRSISVFDSWCRSISRRIISSSSSLSALSILVLVFFISVYLRILVNLVRNRCGFCFSSQFVEFSTFNLARICCRIVQNGNTQTRLGTSVASRLLQLISSHFRSRTSALHWFELSRSLSLSQVEGVLCLPFFLFSSWLAFLCCRLRCSVMQQTS